MKKLLFLLLALAMLLTSLAACGDETQPEGNTTVGNGDGTADPIVTDPPIVTDEWGRPVLESSLPKLDYNNESVTIMIRTANQRHFLGNESTDATILEQALFRRNKIVEDTLNVHLNLVPITQTGSDTSSYDNTIRAALTGAGEYDIVTSYAFYTPALAISGCFADLNKIKMLDMEALCWNTTFAESVAYDGALYFNVGDYSLDYLRQIVGIFFNKNLTANEFGDEEIFYDMVNDGSWTMANAAALLKDLYRDLNTSQVADEGDFYGFYVGATSSPCEALVTGLGFNYTVKADNGDYNIFTLDTALSDTVDALHDFIESEFCAPRAIWNWSKGRDAFINKQALMVVQTLDMAESYANVDFTYGFLPIFKLDESQAEYCTGMGDSFSLQCIMANSKDSERAGAVLQCLNEVSYRRLTPEYFEILLKGRFSDAPQDVEMLELMRRTVRLDFGRIYSVCLDRITGNVWNNFCNAGANYANWYSSNADTYRTKLAELLFDLKNGITAA